jgi:aspartate-semialdehyde dehydrogenase
MVINIAIVGATGAVGFETVKLLNEKNIHFDRLCLLASKKSVGKEIIVNGVIYKVELLTKKSFEGFNYAIFATGSDISKKYAPIAVKSGCIVIDNSSAFRMDPDTPLVIPEINPTTTTKSGIIANPNCSTIILLVAIYPLYKLNKIKKITVSTYQAASGAGMKGINELKAQVSDFVHKRQPTVEVFGKPYLFNVFSHNSPIDLKSGFNEEELKMINETYKIFNTTDIKINPTCIRVPTFRSHLETVDIEFENDTSVEEITEILNKAPGIVILDDREKNRFPEPLITAHQYDVFVGRIRKCFKNDNKNFMFIVSGDQLLKGAALNAIQILELFIKLP